MLDRSSNLPAPVEARYAFDHTDVEPPKRDRDADALGLDDLDRQVLGLTAREPEPLPAPPADANEALRELLLRGGAIKMGRKR